MGIRGEIFSTRLILPKRTYFLNVKENRLGDLYLNIVESKNKDTGGFERQSVIVFADELPAFLEKFDKSLKALEKAVRDQKKGAREESGGRRNSGSRAGEADPQLPEPRRRLSRTDRPDRADRSDRTERPGKPERPDKRRKVVVKRQPDETD